MRAQRGFTAERIARVLRCHGARQLLGHEQQAVADPYWLADAQVQIDVEADGNGFLVSIGSSSIDEARAILYRARTFVARR